MLNLHGSAGVEKKWDSPHEYEQIAGVELVANRIEMAGYLGEGAVITHFDRLLACEEEKIPYWSRMHRSLDALEPVALRFGVKLALIPWITSVNKTCRKWSITSGLQYHRPTRSRSN